MSLSWKNLKSPLLGLQDLIPFGKLKGCRVCDVIQDHYEYLIWADKAGLAKFQPIVVETIQEAAKFADAQIHYEQEVKPWIDEDPKPLILDEDVPF